MRSQPLARAAVFAAAFLTAACQHAPRDPLPPLPPQQVETGSTFTLVAPLAFVPNMGLLFQGQRVVTAPAIVRNRPYCRLVPQSGAPSYIQAGNLTVRSVAYDERESGSAGSMLSVTRITLAPVANQPGYVLSCGWPEASAAPAFVTTEQIYDAIGGQFTMQLLR